MKRNATTSSRGVRAWGVPGRVAMLLMCVVGMLLASAASAAATAPTRHSPFTFDCSVTPARTGCGFDKAAVDVSTGDVYVIDNLRDVVDKFDASGNYLGQITGSSTANRTFGFVAGDENVVAVDNSNGPTQGNVYVVSEGASFGGTGKAIFAFNSAGTELWEATGVNPTPANTDTCGVSVDPNGNPWVSDYAGQVVQELNKADGTLVAGRSLSTAAQGTNPCETAFDASGNLYVDSWHSRLDKYNPNFGFVATLDPGPVLDVATDLLTGDVYAITNNGTQVSEWDSSGTAVSGTPFDTGSPSLTGVAINGTVGQRMAYVSDTSANDIQMWDLPAPPPTVVTTAATNIRQTTATLNGTVNPNGSNATDCHFDYGTTTAYGSQVPCASLPGSGTTPVPVSADVTGLSPHTTYHFRLVATNSSGTGTGNDLTFTTLPDPPAVVTGSASAIMQTGGTVGGTVNPNGGNVTNCHLDYGTTTAYGQTAPCASSPGSGTSPVAVSAALSGLTANTAYHYRVVATNAGGTTDGPDATFTTLPNPPAVTTGAASGIAETGATLGGTVNPNGANVTNCHFDYGTSTSYGSTAPCAAAPGSGSSAVSVSASLSGLAAGTTYHFRLVAANGGGTTAGSDVTFTTSTPPGCPQDLSKCTPSIAITGFTARTLLVRLTCTGIAGQPACSGRLTFKAVIKVRVKHGKKTKLVRKTITVGTASYNVAAGSSSSVKLKLTSAAKTALKSGALTAKCTSPKGTIHLPKTKVRRAKKRH